MKVRCNWCEWTGDENELIIVNEIEYCPHCGNKGMLMDIEDEESEEKNDS